MWQSSHLASLSIINAAPESARDRLRGAFTRDQEQSLHLTAILRFAAVSLLLGLALYLGLVAECPDWRANLHLVGYYWMATGLLSVLVWCGFQPFQWFGCASAVTDIVMIYWLQSSFMPFASSAGGASAYPMSMFCTLIILSSFHLPKTATLAVSTLAAVCEVALMRQAGVGSGAQIIGSVIIISTGVTASFLIERLQHLISVVIREELRRARLGRYFSPSIAGKLAEDGIRTPPPEEHEATILFAELQDFSDLVESLDPSEVVELLNEYYALMLGIVFKYQGTLDKFLGNGLMVYFGAPIYDPRHAELAVRCGLEIAAAVDHIRRSRWERGVPATQVVVGIHTGPVILGNIGSEQRRLEYTAIGDAVNLASRLKSLAAEQRVPILVSDSTRRLAGDRFIWGRREPARVKGKAQPVLTFEPGSKAGVFNRQLHH